MLKISEIKVIITDYLKYRNYSPHTIRNHLKVLNLFNRYLKGERKSNDLREVREADLFDFIEYRKKVSKSDLKKSRLNSYIGSMKTIFRILMEEDKILSNPFGDIPCIKTQRAIRDKILSEDEIKLLLDSFNESRLLGARNKTVISLLYGTGIRASELFNLEVQDFIKEEKLLFVRQGKGKKDRIVPLGEIIYTVLLNYFTKVRPRLVRKKAVRYIFVKRGFKKLSSAPLRGIINSARIKAGIEKHITPHMFRHTFATHMLNNGADIREVQLLLGHESLRATEVYLNLTAGHLKEAYMKHHPLENELYFDVYGRESYIFEEGFNIGINPLNKKNLTKI